LKATGIKLDVGCGNNKRRGFVGLDRCALPHVDVVHDLTAFPWPFDDDSAEEIYLDNVIEHLPDTVATMDELHRIARPGCRVTITYPYFRSTGAYGDPTHVRFFNEHMIQYFLRPGTTRRRENRFAFYTQRYWSLKNLRISTYPFLHWLPASMLLFVARQMLCDVIHSITIEITPDK